MNLLPGFWLFFNLRANRLTEKCIILIILLLFVCFTRHVTKKQNKSNNLNEENKTFKFERHVSATPLPSSVYGWNNIDEIRVQKYIYYRESGEEALGLIE